MIQYRCVLAAAVCAGSLACGAAADEVRHVNQNGTTYREVIRTERRPVADVHFESKQETVYRREYVTEYRQSDRLIYTPVTEYRAEPRLHGRWNPFVQPYVAYHWIPSTRWQTRVEKLRTPVSYSRLAPQTRVVQVPVRTLGFREQEVVVSRVAVAPKAPAAPQSVQSGPTLTARRIGGIATLENDPPRRPVAASGASTSLLR